MKFYEEILQINIIHIFCILWPTGPHCKLILDLILLLAKITVFCYELCNEIMQTLKRKGGRMKGKSWCLQIETTQV